MSEPDPIPVLIYSIIMTLIIVIAWLVVEIGRKVAGK